MSLERGFGVRAGNKWGFRQRSFVFRRLRIYNIKQMKINFLFLALLLLFSCSENDEPTPNPQTGACDGEFTSEGIAAERHISANTSFAFDLFQKSVELEDGNVIQSPTSIYSAFLMLYEGSDCNTKDQICHSLNLCQDEGVFLDVSDTYTEYLSGLIDGSEDYSLAIANTLFYDPTLISLLPSFKETLENSYSASINELDFSEAEASLETINQWASDNTEGKIEKVLDEISPDEVAFIMNALYFKSDWEFGFAEQLTREIPFLLSTGDEVSVPMMSRDAGTLYHKGEEMEMVELPLKNNKYIVNLFIPTDADTPIEDLIMEEDFEMNYRSAVESCEEGRLQLTLPKFELKGKQDLKVALTALGITDAFSRGNADLSQMGTANGNLFVTKALHDTYLKLDEKGIEGAAVTTIGVGVTSVPPSISFSRPFGFVIRQAGTFNPLFIGKIENPLP